MAPVSGYEGPAGDLAVQAKVVDVYGNPLDIDTITWSASPSGASASGASAVLNDLDPGSYTISAQASLPDGQELTATVSPINLRSAYSGVYTGSVEALITSDYFDVACTGELEATVDEMGEVITGTGTCSFAEGSDWATLALNLSGTVDGAGFEGTMGADLGWLGAYDLEASGSFSGGGLNGSFGADYGYFVVDGAFDLSE